MAPSGARRIEVVPITGGIHDALSDVSEKTARAADRALLSTLDARISELESSLHALKEDRVLVQDRLDAYRYPVLTLPNEITSEIFVHCLPPYPECPPSNGLLSPYLLCQICRRWQSIALSTPRLWRAISLCPRIVKERQTLRLLGIWLARSGSCLLSIMLKGQQKWSFDARKLIESYARCEHLALLIFEVPCTLPAGPLSLPSLRTLKLSSAINLAVSSTRLAAPLLQKLSIGAYHDGHRSVFPWPQLTVLSVGSITINQCADILTRSVNIVCCRFSISSIRDFDDSWSVTLSHLETFIILQDHPNYFEPRIQRSIVDALTLPALRRLQVSRILIAEPRVAIGSLISRSGCSLNELCIPNSGPVSRSLHRSLPSVTKFIFDVDGELAVSEPFLEESVDEADAYSENDEQSSSAESYSEEEQDSDDRS
ncbi:hypothetical protein C8R47DRAFT_1163926 [Mycena vitilis]|nr:hypothetical protein C8R47DRAFT_1163926 [Mycena vitilis]